MNNHNIQLPSALIISKIHHLRGVEVMLDADIAELYGVETRRLMEQVRRNSDRFPEDFFFQLTDKEWEALRSQNATLNEKGRGKHTKYPPHAFSEQGVYMVATVLRTPVAAATSIAIMRTFTQLRHFALNYAELVKKLSKMEEKYDQNFQIVFQALEELMQDAKESGIDRIGFIKEPK